MANKKNIDKMEITDLTPDGKRMYLVRNKKIYSSNEAVSYYNISNLIDYSLFDEDDHILIIVRAFVENDIDGSTAGLEYVLPLDATLDEEHTYYLKIIMNGVLNDIFKNRVLDDIRVRDKVKTQIEQIQFTIAQHNTRGREVVTDVLHFTNVAKRLYRLTYSDYELYYLLKGKVKDPDDEYYEEEVDEEDLYRPTQKGGLDREIIDQLAENVNEELNKDMLKKED